jgi:hypothetical protein
VREIVATISEGAPTEDGVDEERGAHFDFGGTHDDSGPMSSPTLRLAEPFLPRVSACGECGSGRWVAIVREAIGTAPRRVVAVQCADCGRAGKPV